MGEMIDGFNALHSVRALERATLRESAPKILADRGIEFTSYNNGAHLLVSHNGKLIDFWPGAEKWMVRGNKKKHYGSVDDLIKFVGDVAA